MLRLIVLFSSLCASLAVHSQTKHRGISHHCHQTQMTKHSLKYAFENTREKNTYNLIITIPGCNNPAVKPAWRRPSEVTVSTKNRKRLIAQCDELIKGSKGCFLNSCCFWCICSFFSSVHLPPSSPVCVPANRLACESVTNIYLSHSPP